MDEFCLWITKFLKSSPTEEEIDEKAESMAKAYISLDKYDDTEKEQNSVFQTIIEALK